MRFKLRSIELLAILIIVSSCSINNKIIPPELKPSYTKLEVLTRIQELQNTTISLSDSKQLDKDKADVIVRFTIASAEAINSSTTNDWITSVKKGWTKLKENMIITADSKLNQIWLIIDYMVTSL